MHHLRTLIAIAGLAAIGYASAQSVPCPGETLTFQLEGEYYGTKTWEYSADGVTWNAVDVVENTPFVLQPEQSGWYRVRFYDEACDVSYFSEPQRFVAPNIDLGGTLTISIGGVVKNEFGLPVFGATVRAGCGAGVSTTTDHFGVYRLDGVVVREGLATVTVEKEGYFTGSRSFVPAESADEAISHAYITLVQRSLASTVPGSSGGSVVWEGVTISFPANSFQQNGQPFAGAVSVFLNHIDPTGDDLHGQMPGMLMGVQDDQPQLLYSYGMAGVELADAAGVPVQLASGVSATVRFPVMASQQADAPTTIPLWWFDEDLGYWVEEGEAQRVGNEYVGQVAHFSWWNIDVPGDFVSLSGTVIDDVTGAIFANAQVRLISTTMGTGVTFTNAAGGFAGMVPMDEALTLQVWLPCGPQGADAMVYQEMVGPFSAGSAIVVEVSSPEMKLVHGEVVDCAGVPVEDGYVWADGQVVFCTQGSFAFTSCASSVNLRAVDMAADNVSGYMTVELSTDTTDVGDLIACTPMFGTVTDIDGNTYATVIIGEQEWMAEDLKTTRYNDGSSIPNVTGNTAWAQLGSGAWSNYNNSPANDATYGKLYNWYAAANPNICPQGWHVPTDLEWQQLEAALGMPASELGQTAIRGIAQNVGGKMKTTSLWDVPNAGATNESGFSGLPGGGRGNGSGAFLYLGINGYWWSASDSSAADAAWFRGLTNSSAGIFRDYYSKKWGFCVRCVRD